MVCVFIWQKLRGSLEKRHVNRYLLLWDVDLRSDRPQRSWGLRPAAAWHTTAAPWPRPRKLTGARQNAIPGTRAHGKNTTGRRNSQRTHWNALQRPWSRERDARRRRLVSNSARSGLGQQQVLGHDFCGENRKQHAGLSLGAL